MPQKTRNLEFCLGTNVGTNHAKIEKMSMISRAIQLGFLRFPVSAIRCEANKNNRREERPIGSRAVKLLTDLLLRARSLARRAACGRGKRARRRESTSQRIEKEIQLMEGEISIVQSIQLGISRSLGSATSNEANTSNKCHSE